MPASPMVPASLLAVLGKLRVFTAPGFTTFTAMVTGLVAQAGASTVTGMLTWAGLARAWPHDRAHAFFSRTRWNVDNLGILLAHLIVRTLLPQGAAITVTVDDTLFKRSGKKVFGAAWQHDGAARGPKPVGRGTCFVVVGIVVELPFLTRPVCLPVMARLWQPKTGPSKVELAASMVKLLAVCLNRPLHVVANAAYHGRACATCPRRSPSPPGCRPAPCCSTSRRRRPRSAAAPPQGRQAGRARRTRGDRRVHDHARRPVTASPTALDRLQTIVQVPGHPSIAAAARAIYGIRDGALRQRITKIEKAAGFQIIDRSAAPLAPTPRGHDFLRKATEILRITDKIRPKSQ